MRRRINTEERKALDGRADFFMMSAWYALKNQT